MAEVFESSRSLQEQRMWFRNMLAEDASNQVIVDNDTNTQLVESGSGAYILDKVFRWLEAHDARNNTPLDQRFDKTIDHSGEDTNARPTQSAMRTLQEEDIVLQYQHSASQADIGQHLERRRVQGEQRDLVEDGTHTAARQEEGTNGASSERQGDVDSEQRIVFRGPPNSVAEHGGRRDQAVDGHGQENEAAPDNRDAIHRGNPPNEPSNLRVAAWSFSCGVGALIPIGLFALVIAILIVFAQNSTLNKDDNCTARLFEIGFQGNPEFYGLGIRIGVYLQWWASFIANVFLPKEWKPMYYSYMAFSIALVSSLLMLSVQHSCTFTAEIIVNLFFLWGGIFGTAYCTDASIEVVTKKKIDLGWGLAGFFPLCVGFAFSVWFWLRLVTVGEVDFTPTPGGTMYFLFARVSAQQKVGAGFILTLALYFGFFALLSSFISLGLAGFGMLYVFLRLINRGHRFTNFMARRLGAPPMDEERGQPEEEERPAGEQRGAEEARRQSPTTKFCASLFSMAAMVYSMIAIELTLYWNGVTNVYDIDTTSQMIPLVLGLGIIFVPVWKLCKHLLGYDREDEEEAKEEEEQEGHEMQNLRPAVQVTGPIQHVDGTEH